jgi:hypothetical protein
LVVVVVVVVVAASWWVPLEKNEMKEDRGLRLCPHWKSEMIMRPLLESSE